MKDTNYDFIGQTRRWVMISAAVIAVSLVALVAFGLNLSIDFVGGSSYDITSVTRTDFASADLVAAAEGAGATDVSAQVKLVEGVPSGAIVTMGALEVGGDVEAAVQQALIDLTGAEVSDLAVKTVGPSWGDRISRKALEALIVFLIVVMIYITVRLEAKMAGAAIVALVHDVLITIGIYAIVRFTVSPSTVIALLTILGYSLYDTVVVFDRVDEATIKLGEPGRRTYAEAVNTSLNDVLWRSVNTSLTSLLPVGSLLIVGSVILGQSALQDLSLALFVGMGIGTYSSIFVAGPFLVWWKNREPEHAARQAALDKAIAAGEAPSAAEMGHASVVAKAPITTEYVRGRGRKNRTKR